MSFDSFGLSEAVLKAIADVGYTQPTPIQQQAIPVVLQGRDVLGCAQTGTGKTASFTLPMIEALAGGRTRARMPRSLILEPTRELASQVAQNFELYGRYTKLNYALLIGGESFVDQERTLERGVDVLIATPGRLIDLFERGKILMSDVRILVIDEADRMLDMGFIPDIERIVSLLPTIRQTLFFSATMPNEIRRLADNFLINPMEITVAPPASPAATVEQHLSVVAGADKRQALRSLLNQHDPKNAIVFCNRKRDVDILVKSLQQYGYDAATLHGDMPQYKRMETLDRFRAGDLRLLVASDVAARGLDIPAVSHVFNFDVPIHAEDYVHRIGRTGRAGRSGVAFTLAAPADTKYVEDIEKLIDRQIQRLDIDGVETVDLDEGEARGSRGRRGRSGGSAKPAAAAPSSDKPKRAPRRSRKQDAAPAAPEPVAEEAPPPVEETAAPAKSEPKPEAKRPPEQKAEPAPSHGKAASGKPSGRQRQREDESTPVGFGDEIPAFMLRRGKTNRTKDAS